MRASGLSEARLGTQNRAWGTRTLDEDACRVPWVHARLMISMLEMMLLDATCQKTVQMTELLLLSRRPEMPMMVLLMT